MPRGHDVHARAERRIRQDHTDTASAEFEHQLLSGPPQTIQELGDKDYDCIREEGGIDERFIVN